LFELRSSILKKILVLLLSIAFSHLLIGQHIHSHTSCLKVIPVNAHTYVPPSVNVPNPSYASFSSSSSTSNTIIVNYTGFGSYPQAQSAFQYAVDIWAAILPINVPIVIEANFDALGTNVLGSAGPYTFINNFSNAPQPNIFYPIALANTLAGFDILPNDPDINATFSNQFNWYYGTDGNPPSGTADFVSVVLHELAHGFGYVSSFNYDNGDSSDGTECTGVAGLGCVNVPNVTFDPSLSRANGTLLNSYPTNSTAMASAETSNDVYWDGSSATSANSGVNPKIHAPNPYEPGSSLSHLDENTYPSGNPNSLMTAFIFLAEAIHDPGPITLGILQDIGWPFNGCLNNITVTDLISSGLYEANDLVETSGTVFVTTSASYHSGNEIDLNNGFHVTSNGEFTADIQPCGTAPRLANFSLKMSRLDIPLNSFCK